jgi:pimeloyl-ACP methyl ester carboxylesterase
MAGRQQWRRIIAILVALTALVAASVMGLLTPYFLAARSASIAYLTLSSVLSFALVVWLGTKAALLIWAEPRLKRSAAVLIGSFTVIYLAALYFAILRPSGSHFPDVIPFKNTRYWRLSTGSLIAYSEYDPPPGVVVKPEALVYLHGGPGARQAPFDQQIYGGFANQGFRVFLFDQAGSGLSGFLPHVRDYTLGRSIEDLEAVRQRIGVEKMILIGHSWGSTLAANYMARYPSHVSKVIFHSPARLWDLGHDDYDYSRTAAEKMGLPAPRLLAALLLRDRNPDAAENLVSQREAEMLLVPSFRETLGTVVCGGDFNRVPADLIAAVDGHENPGINPYVLQELIPATEDPNGDPHAALRGNHTPAILLYPECNYLSWKGAVDYRNTFPNLKIYYVPRAGHYIQFEQPELLKNVILAFLLNQPDAIPAYSGDVDPRGKHP